MARRVCRFSCVECPGEPASLSEDAVAYADFCPRARRWIARHRIDRDRAVGEPPDLLTTSLGSIPPRRGP